MIISYIITICEFLFLCTLKNLNVEVPNSMAFVLIMIFVAAFMTDSIINKKYKDYKLQLFVAIALRIGLLITDLYLRDYITIPGSGLDSEGYYEHAVLFSQGVYREYGGLYGNIIGCIFVLIGTNRMIGQFINIIFSLVSILTIIKIFDLLNLSHKTKQKSAWIICSLPYFASLSSIFLRESIMIMIVSISFMFFIRYHVKKQSYCFILAIALSLFAAAFHSGCVGIAFGYMLTLLLYNNKQSAFSIKATNIIFAILFFVLFIFLFVNFSDVLFARFMNIESITDINSSTSEDGSSYAKFVGTSSSPMNMLIFTIPRIVFFSFSPLPVSWRGFMDILSFLFDSMFYFISIFNTFVMIFKHKKTNSICILTLIILAPALIVFGWGCNYAGTAIRHRCKFVSLFMTMLAISIDNHENKNKKDVTKNEDRLQKLEK